MSQPCVFVFQFSLDDQDLNGEYLSEQYGFVISAAGYEKIKGLIQTGDFYDEIVEPIESEYGVHDSFGNGPFDKVEMIGFETYEIQGPYIKKCMKAWHEKMIELCGVENISKKVFDLSRMDVKSSAEEFYLQMGKKII